jgi:hypothetical protein
MIWSIVGIAVLASVYGIVQIFQETVGIDDTAKSTFPTLPTVGS